MSTKKPPEFWDNATDGELRYLLIHPDSLYDADDVDDRRKALDLLLERAKKSAVSFLGKP